VIPDQEIEQFVANQRQGDLWNICAVMQGIWDLTNTATVADLDRSLLDQIKALAGLVTGDEVESLMDKIVAALESGTEEGIYAAWKTALRVIESAYECSPGPPQLRRRYKSLLRAEKRKRARKEPRTGRQ